ncbi:MAG TPA: hypothetical protein PLB01_11130 [Thermoanaerobaculia bacterium]|nr:hypothetical protein [Thermoanaerobaculia bacterium]
MRSAPLLALAVSLAGAAAFAAVASPPLEERDVVWQEAEQGGATLPEPSVADVSAGCRATTGVARSGGALFSLRCPGSLGTKSAHPAYANLHLKNGWKVKDTRVVVVGSSKAGFDLEKPAPGSDQPFVKGKLWAGPGGEVLIEVYVKVEGPRGTRPY